MTKNIPIKTQKNVTTISGGISPGFVSAKAFIESFSIIFCKAYIMLPKTIAENIGPKIKNTNGFQE